MAAYAQSVAYTRAFKMIDSADHFSKKTGLTCTVNISKAGAAFGAAAGTVTEVANGWYKVALTTADTGTIGDLAFYITATGADDTDFVDQVIDPVRGLGAPTALPNTACTTNASLITSGTGTDQLSVASGRIDAGKILGTAISTPATAGILDVNVKNMNNVAATSITTINANQGTTQPVNFTGTAGSALVKSDMVDIAGAAVSTASAQIGVNAVNIGGTSQTGRDIGASVLLSAGTGTGQLDFTSGVVKANLAQILGTTLTETAGLLAAGFKQFFNIASPTSTMNTITTVTTTTTATNLTNAPTNGDLTATMKTSVTTAATAATPTVTTGTLSNNVITAASINASALNGKGDWNIGKTGYALSAAGVQAIWDALTSALTTVGSIGKLLVDNINATILSRMATYTQPTGFLAATFPSTIASTTNITTASGVALTSDYDAAKTAAQASDIPTANITAIKAKTDQLTFTVANQVDSNAESMNATAINGTGISGDLWRGA